eukprot:COSAG05_NODE_551_length_8736_cov_5.409401_6_plen_111_part_00
MSQTEQVTTYWKVTYETRHALGCLLPLQRSRALEGRVSAYRGTRGDGGTAGEDGGAVVIYKLTSIQADIIAAFLSWTQEFQSQVSAQSTCNARLPFRADASIASNFSSPL